MRGYTPHFLFYLINLDPKYIIVRLKSVAILLSIVIFPLIGVGQSPPYINYKGGDQIPSSETYHVIQDTKGYIWVATACGVSRFDGYEFTTFTLKDGLPDNVIHEIYEDYKGRIWFVSYSGQLSYFFEGKIYPYKYNYLMTGIFAGGEGSVKMNFCVTKNDEVLVSIKRKGAYSISREGQVNKVFRSAKTTLTITASPLSSHVNISYDFEGLKSGKIEITGLDGKTSLISHKSFEGLMASHVFSVFTNKTRFFTLDANLYQWNGSKITQQKYKNPIIWLSQDRLGLMWVSEFNGGLCCYNNSDINIPPILKLFDSLSVTSVLCDKEGGYWFSTYGNGLFYVSNIWNKTFFWNSVESKESKIVAVGHVGTSLWVSFENSTLVEISNDNQVRKIIVPGLSSRDLYFNSMITQPNSSRVWLLSNCYLYEFSCCSRFKRYYNGYEMLGSQRGIYPRSLAFRGDTVFVGARIGFLIMGNGQVIYDSFKAGDFKSTVNGMALAKDGTLWLGCSDGLWKFKNGKFEWMGEVTPFFRNRISRVAINPIDSSVWVGTRGGGIGVFNGSTLSFISTDDGLPSDIITSIAMGVDRVWVGSSSGVAQVSIVPDISGKYIVSSFDKSIGIVSNEILDLLPTDSTLIIGTRDGVLSYRLEDNRNQVKPKVLITKLSVNGRDTSVLNNLNLDYFQNNISISFAGFTYKTLRNTLFRYRLHESDSIYSYTRIPSVILPALSPGKYSFEVWAQNAYGQWSVSPAKFHFSILSPFWRMPWFVFLISVAGFLLFSFVFAFRLRALKQHNILSRRLDGWKQQALLQQMNPHFIFNTLNSIQLFILQNDTRSSQRYLTKFAKLMRLTLENSQSFSVSFTNELEALRLYLELEALRAEKKFEFEIVVDGSLPLEVNIPSLIVQPFVENAIWHGVMPKGKGGRIIVTFKFRENKVLCTIEDNGIGRLAASKYASAKAHKSRGSEITTQRLQLLKSMYGQQLGIVYIDLKDSLDQPAGTRVELVIPILPAKNILD